MKLKKLLLLLFISVNVFAVTIDTGHANVSLIKYKHTENGNESNLIGIKMDMQSGWHTYWKNPGDSGGPIKVKWVHDDKLEIGEILWPPPELIPYEPLMTYGYKDFVIFPFEVINNGANSNISATIDFLICSDICVPEMAVINTSISDIDYDVQLKKWFDKVPRQTLPVKASINDGYIDIRFSNNELLDSAVFFVDDENAVEHAADQILIKEENNWLLRVKKNSLKESISLLSGVISIKGDSYIVKTEIDESSSSSSSSEIGFLQAIIFAFVGGLILNLMPCVFPIISLKVLSFVSMSNQSESKVRNHALSFCAGVIISFLMIGFAMILLKQTGAFLGWGFQLQSPLIVGILCILMFVIGVILLSDINIGSSLTRYGNVGSNNSFFGSFLTGVLAVIVASPCTAPFMGAALGYALIQPSGITLPVFASLGIGFSLPYFLLSISPNLITYLPKPGNWMITLKEFFAFPMFATALWLLWVFSLQAGTDALITLLLTILIISLFIWIHQKLTSPFLKIIMLTTMALIVFYQLRNISLQELPINNVDVAKKNMNFVSWEKNIEENFKKDNQAYLINFTAAWCITCQANDKIAISRPSVKEYLQQNDIKYIVADWTNKDKEILLALESYNRNGVPLYIFWKPGMQESKILPAILTEQILLDGFNNS